MRKKRKVIYRRSYSIEDDNRNGYERYLKGYDRLTPFEARFLRRN